MTDTLLLSTENPQKESMMNRTPQTIVATASTLLLLGAILTGCSSTSTAPAASTTAASTTAPSSTATIPDLTGTWTEPAPSSSPASSPASATQSAVITGTTIEITWHNTDGSTALYWAGSVIPPTAPGDSYSWDSANDTSKTGSALLASSDPTKHFDYKNGKLSYQVSALGVTKTEVLQKD